MEINQDNELSAVKRKIRALLAKTTDAGATESEAMFAMNKVGELLVQYNLSMNEVTLREEPCVTKAFSTGSKQRDVTWNIHSGIAQMLGVKVWVDRRSKGIDWKFFGLESDVDMAIYLYDFIQKAERTASEAFKKTEIYRNWHGGNRKTLTTNFRTGFGQRINDRLIEIAQENEKIEREAHAFHTAKAAKEGIMVGATDEAQAEAARQKTGSPLIGVAKAKKVEEEFKKSGLKLCTRTVRSSTRYNSGARAAGGSAANNVNLNRPVSGAGSKSNLRIA